MAYEFNTQNSANATITDELANKFTLKGINGTTSDATAVMGGLSIMLDIVGWTVADAKRVITQDIDEVEEP